MSMHNAPAWALEEVIAFARERTRFTGQRHAVMGYKPTMGSAWRYYSVSTRSKSWHYRIELRVEQALEYEARS